MATNTNSTSRRAVIAALAGTPFLVGTMAGATAPSAGSVANRAEWNRAFAEWQKADAAEVAFEPEWERLSETFEAGRPSIDMIDWRGLGFVHCINKGHTARVMDVEAEWQQYLADYNLTWFSPKPDECRAKMRKALDSVLAFRKAEADYRRDSGMGAADERIEELGDRAYDLKWALMKMPAPDTAALLWKLELLLRADADNSVTSWDESAIAATKADMRRLLSHGRA